MTVVKLELAGGQSVASAVTRESVDDLRLAVGSQVTVLIKSTEVSLGVE